MIATNRLLAEQRFHDDQAADRAASFESGRADLVFTDADYLDHETWIRPAIAMLGNLNGKRILDYGCGHGMAAVVFARAGANVAACDLAPGYIAEARARAAANRVSVDCRVCRGEELPFADESFDAVWGNAILHHLDLDRAARELLRVMKPGGTAIFCEPWGGNPLLAFARRRLPYAGKDRTRDERPIGSRDLAPLRQAFGSVQMEGHQFFGMVRRVCGNRRAVRYLDRLDARVLRWFPILNHWCRYAVIAIRKPAA